MATSYSALLGLALPVQGELSGTWGDTVNNYITTYLDSAIAGAQTLSTDADVTLTKTTGTVLGTTSSQYAILLCSGARTAQRTITVPAASKLYAVVNATTGGFAVKIVGSGPTTGVTIPNGMRAFIIWNGSDFNIVSMVDASGITTVPYGGTGVTTLTGVAYGNGTSAFTAATGAQISSALGSTAVTNATNATNATNTGITEDTATATAVYPTWVTSNTGNLPQKTTSTKLSFVPSTGVLTATSFSGAGTGLTGTASSLTAGAATSATNATNTGITEDTTTATAVYPTWVTSNTGNLPQKTTSTKLSFVPSTGVLTATSFSGAGTGLTGTASSLTAGTASALTTGNNYRVNSIGVGAAASGTAGRVNATTGVFTPNTSGVSTGLTVANGDLTAYRSGGTTGVVYLSSSGSNYLYWDGTNYNLGASVALHAGNYNSYAPTLTGTGASGSWGISVTGSSASCTGNAASASAVAWTGITGNPTAAAGAVPGNLGIARADASGYTYFNYLNSNTANSENPAVSQVIVTNGTDNFYRKSSIASFTSAVQSNASGSWGISVTGSSASCTGNAATATSATSATNATNLTGSGTISSTTTATTQTAGTNNTTVATTAFVQTAVSGGSGAVKAWVNFNGTGTVTIRAQLNVGSITDNGVGDYTVNFTSGLTDANYAVAGSAGTAGSATGLLLSPLTTAQTAFACRLLTTNASLANTDHTYATAAFFR